MISRNMRERITDAYASEAGNGGADTQVGNKARRTREWV